VRDQKKNQKNTGKSKKKPASAAKAEAASAIPPIVGIGASAGGLEAFTELLRHLPSDTGMAFVLVQHLDPKHASVLPDLLAKSSSMPVGQVENRMVVKANHVYVIPPNTNMTVSKSVFHLEPRASDHGMHLPVDAFLSSLAADQKNRAVGVILSGTGSDGTAGLKAIKAEGGITIAQDKKSAKYDGMPASAVAAGCVDLVLPPDAIAGELVRIGRHPYVSATAAAKSLPESSGEDENYRRLFVMLHSAIGVDFTHYKPNTIRRRIMRRMVLHKLDSLEDYVGFVRKNRGELQLLSQDMLINVTGFFREPESFALLSQKALPDIVKQHSADSPIRVWTPGCSTGEEVYSIAISVLEYLRDENIEIPIQIFGTDVSETALAKARQGIYPESISSDVSRERLRRWFNKTPHGYQVSSMIRERCVFAKHNVAQDPPFSKLDLLSCRNVLIYLDPLLQRRIFSLFHYALTPGGILILGSSESLACEPGLFVAVDKKHKLFRRSLAPNRAIVDWPVREQADGSAKPNVALGQKEWTSADIKKKAEEILLARYGPPGAVVNEDGLIIQFHGHTGLYLEPASGEASLNLLKMARPGLDLTLRSLLHEAIKTHATVRKNDVPLRANGDYREIAVTITPIPSGAASHYLVTFEEKASRQAGGRKSARIAPAKSSSQRVAKLEEELAEAKQRLQAIIEDQEASNEELKSANEEIESSNEELRSTNEELETAKEELQSTNEELVTLNEELQVRNTELGRLYDDLGNLLASVNIPIVMLAPDMAIRRFTPYAEKIFNLAPADVGRSILDIRSNVDLADLEQLVQAVAADLTPIEREIRDRNGHWYSMWIRPYKSMDNKIDGTVLAFSDIDDIKRSLDEAGAARDYAESIIETVRQPLLVLDSEWNVKTASHSFCQVFRIPRSEALGAPLAKLGGGEWDIPQLRAMLEATARGEGAAEPLELEADFERAGPKTLLLDARKIEQPGERHLILLAIEDITERVSASEARYRRLFEAAYDGILLIDGESGRIIDVNPALVALLGHPRLELLGATLWESPPFQENDLGRAIYLLLQKKDSVYYGALQLPHRKGGRVDCAVVGSVYREGGRKMIELNVRDITERRQAEERLKASLNEKETLLKELHHRVKNNLQVISSLLNLQAEHITDPKTLAIFSESRNRVKSIALMHEVLHQSKDLATIDMCEYVRSLSGGLFRTFGIDADRIRLKIDANGVSLNVDQAFPCGLMLNELVTNSLKHAFPDGRKGQVQIALEVQDKSCKLTVADDGIGLAGDGGFPETGTLGLQLVQTLAQQLGGTIGLDRTGGVRYEIAFPVKA
jgi:two-component system CheB/CheR fusion protein